MIHPPGVGLSPHLTIWAWRACAGPRRAVKEHARHRRRPSAVLDSPPSAVRPACRQAQMVGSAPPRASPGVTEEEGGLPGRRSEAKSVHVERHGTGSGGQNHRCNGRYGAAEGSMVPLWHHVKQCADNILLGGWRHCFYLAINFVSHDLYGNIRLNTLICDACKLRLPCIGASRAAFTRNERSMTHGCFGLMALKPPLASAYYPSDG